MTRSQAITAASRFLEPFSSAGSSIVVYCWHEDTFRNVGVRVAKVSFIKQYEDGSMSGASYMQADPDGLLVCAAVERLILTYMDPDAAFDEIASTESLVSYILRGKK